MISREQCLQFECGGETLVGVLSLPDVATETCILIVVGGPQCRAGSHRMFVVLAREMAAAGHAALRFDVRGMGDSTGAQRPFTALGQDIAAAIEATQTHLPSVRRFVIWGLCDGASAALLYVDSHQDPRVAAVCLANPWVRSEHSLARTQIKHYYANRLLDLSFWRKLLSGSVGLSAVAGLFRNLAKAVQSTPQSPDLHAGATALAFQDRMASGLNCFAGPVLLLLSEADYTAKEFIEYSATDPAWPPLLQRRNVETRILLGADHTFSSDAALRAMVDRTQQWLQTAPQAWRT